MICNFFGTLTLCLVLLSSTQAFLPSAQNNVFRKNLATESTTLHMHDVAQIITSAANSVWLATIDSDIEAIPENEFATVFAGGIGVMFGGVVSTVIVGFILDKTDIYANLAAESYLQTADDAEFWKGLSEEEKVMAEAALNRIKESRGEVLPPTNKGSAEDAEMPISSSVEKDGEKPSQEQSSAPKDIFSDY